MSSNDKDLVKKPLPAVEVEEVADTDLDDMAGGDCTAESCGGTCSTTCGSSGGKKIFEI